jgi:hypothetical protein
MSMTAHHTALELNQAIRKAQSAPLSDPRFASLEKSSFSQSASTTSGLTYYDLETGAKLDAIRKGCGVDLKKLPPLEDQLKAALWELQHTEKNALAKIKAATTAYDAGHDAARFWERPASTAQYANRGSTAEKWAVFFGKHPV